MDCGRDHRQDAPNETVALAVRSAVWPIDPIIDNEDRSWPGGITPGNKCLTFERRERISITLNRPDTLNQVDGDMHHDLSVVFEEINRDPGCDVVVLTGAGRAFCAGGSASWMQGMIDDPAKFRAIGPDAKRIVFSLLELEKPIICRLTVPLPVLAQPSRFCATSS